MEVSGQCLHHALHCRTRIASGLDQYTRLCANPVIPRCCGDNFNACRSDVLVQELGDSAQRFLIRGRWAFVAIRRDDEDADDTWYWGSRKGWMQSRYGLCTLHLRAGSTPGK